MHPARWCAACGRVGVALVACAHARDAREKPRACAQHLIGASELYEARVERELSTLASSAAAAAADMLRRVVWFE